ncbi:PTPRJ phosphatase, partial [Alectura lathami]|nr:PTPRJ phosphatase [Alectura lathami]
FPEPSPVFDLKAVYIGATSVNLTWTANDTASGSYSYRIEVANDAFVSNTTSNATGAEITGLIPGTLYTFTVFAVAADGRTEGEGASISLYTQPSPVLDLKAAYVGATSVNLTWTANDMASGSYSYRIEVANDAFVSNTTSHATGAEITGLMPGTLYRFTVFAVAADGRTEGEGASISLYTQPNQVLDLKAAYVGATSVNLTWMANDMASGSYSYRIEVANDAFVSNTTSNATGAEITGLMPGTLYRFTVFAVAADGRTEGEGASISLYTQPSPVFDLKAVYVGATSVNLTWTANDTASGSYSYRIEAANDAFISNMTSNATGAEITGLIPGTLYRFTVFAVAADGRTEGEGASISLYT